MMLSDKSKSFSGSESELLIASTQTLANKKGFPDEFKYECSRLLRFFYDPTKDRFLKRYEHEWARFLFFYFCFFAFISIYAACAFALYLEVYIDKNHPRTQGNDTLLMGWPSLALRPMPDQRTSLIRFIQGQAASYKPYADHIGAFLLQYENAAQDSEALIDCSNLGDDSNRNKMRACRFVIDVLGQNCTWQNDFGYDQGQPCILLKMSRIFGWEPNLYDTNDQPPELGSRFDAHTLGVTCEGENPIDQENIGPINYYPATGFPRYYFPYLNQEGYRQPLVMVQFIRPTNGIVINVWCKLWARGITHHRYDQMGGVHFELLID